MDIYKLGMINWWESQCYYHALAYLGREGIILCRPAEPYVCLGLHDDLEQEIDKTYCENAHLPLIRRETGGGVVYLDSCQIFYQVVLHRENHLLPMKRDKFFAKVLRPAIDVCRSFGIDAELEPPADIKAGGKKCSGNAAGDIGQAVAYVGNLLMDFDYEAMSNVLNVSVPEYRQYFCKAMQDNMLVLSSKGDLVDIHTVESMLIEGFENIFGILRERDLDDELIDMAEYLKNRLTSDEWLSMPGRRHKLRRIKVTEGLFLQECKTVEGKNALQLIRNGQVEEIHVIGESCADHDGYKVAEVCTKPVKYNCEQTHTANY